MKNSYKILNSIVTCLALTSCSLAPKYKPVKFELPKKTEDKILNKYAVKNWWTIFKDETLNQMIDEAIKNNLDIEIAVARVFKAMAFADIKKADLFPTINLDGSASRSEISGNSYMMRAIGGMFNNHQNNFKLNACLSYELDLFAKYRNSSKAAVHSFLATEADKDSMILSVTSQVAKLYFTLLTLDEKIDIAKRTFKSRQATYNIYKKRKENGFCNELELLRVSAEMEAVRAIVFDLESALQTTETALSVLLGKSPRFIVEKRNKRGLKLQNINFLNIVPSNIHSELMRMRPDIKAAELRLIAANANIGSTRAAFFPSITLTTVNGFESSKLNDVLCGGSNGWNLIGGFAMPIFQAGRIKNMIESAVQDYKISEANYKKVVQTAFKETKDAIYINAQNRSVLSAKTRQKNALQKSFDLASKQKEAGLIGLVDLLDVERNLLNTDIEQANATLNLLHSIVELCKSLGGGWKTNN